MSISKESLLISAYVCWIWLGLTNTRDFPVPNLPERALANGVKAP